MFKLLIDEIKAKSGLQFVRHKDCNVLSELIYNETEERLSPSTLKRCMGLVKTKSAPSQHTLHVLSLFLGYRSIEDFERQNSAANETDDFSIDDFLANTQRISEQTREFIWEKGIFNKNYLIQRTNTVETCQAFMEDSSVLCPIIGPGGSGKSVALFQLYELFREDDDHALFYTCGQLFNGYADLLEELDGFGHQPLHKKLEEWLSEKKDRRFTILIDALDEINGTWTELKKLCQTLMHLAKRFKDYSGFKIVISLRGRLWGKLTQQNAIDSKSPLLFQRNLAEDEYTRTIPPLTPDEHEHLLSLHRRNKYTSLPDFFEIDGEDIQILSEPLYFQLFMSMTEDQKAETSLLNLTHTIFHYQLMQSDETQGIIQYLHRFIEATEYAKNGNQADLNRLLNGSERLHQAHALLKDTGFIIERSDNSQIPGKPVASFRHDIFFEYVLAYHLYHRQTITPERLSRIFSEYESSEYIRSIIAHLFWFMYIDRRLDLMEWTLYGSEESDQSNSIYIHTFLQKVSQKRPHIGYINKLVRSDDEFKQRLIVDKISDKLCKILFFEIYSVINPHRSEEIRLWELYLDHANTEEEIAFSNSVLLRFSLANADVSGVEQYSSRLDEIPVKLDNIHPYPCMRSVGYRLLSYHLLGKNDENLTSDLNELHFENIPMLWMQGPKDPLRNFGYHKYLYPGCFVTGKWEQATADAQNLLSVETDTIRAYLPYFGYLAGSVMGLGIAFLNSGDGAFYEAYQRHFQFLSDYEQWQSKDIPFNLETIYLIDATIEKNLGAPEEKIKQRLLKALHWSHHGHDRFWSVLLELLLETPKAEIENRYKVDLSIIDRIGELRSNFWEVEHVGIE